MSLVQILAIWGAASAALFSFPVQSGEWENFKDLKEALVRSSSKRDLPLPIWASSLDYPRPFHFYDLPANKKTEKLNDSPLPVSAPSIVPVQPFASRNGVDTGNAKHD